MLVVGTESGIDYGKPISGWVHRLCGLSPNCRSFEVKHACYGGTAALRTAASWVASGVRPGKKALVISTDLSRPPHSGRVHIEQSVGTHSPEFILGGCAIAAIVGDEPAVLELELDRAGYWTQEIADTFRPTSRDEEGDQIESLCSYLDALDGAYDHFESVVGEIDYDASFSRHIYHVPFPGMAREAHAAVRRRLFVCSGFCSTQPSPPVTGSRCSLTAPGVRESCTVPSSVRRPRRAWLLSGCRSTSMRGFRFRLSSMSPTKGRATRSSISETSHRTVRPWVICTRARTQARTCWS
jgi:3-hydroxy-3-methylglutaryl CoA synthase